MPRSKVVQFLVDLIRTVPSIKGGIGEMAVNFTTWLLLDEKLYRRISNITLSVDDSTTQIDHVVVSPFGVFVIETKNMSGWIFGGEKDAQWTQTFRRKKHRFQNPLHQNAKHVRVLAEQFDIEERAIHSVVVFVGEAEFKTRMPPNVRQHTGVVRYIQSFTAKVLSDEEVNRIVRQIGEQRLPENYDTHAQHVRNVRASQERKAAAKAEADAAILSSALCPECGAALVERTAKRGENVGSKFLGCSSYPKCRYTLNRE